MKLNTMHLLLICSLHGCVYFPVPEHGLVSGRAMISTQQLRDVQPGIDSRESILLMFGDPSSIYDDESIFVYHWERITGWVGSVGAAAEVSQSQYFAVVFDENSKVLKADIIDPLVIQSPDELLEELLDSWRSESVEAK